MLHQQKIISPLTFHKMQNTPQYKQYEITTSYQYTLVDTKYCY